MMLRTFCFEFLRLGQRLASLAAFRAAFSSFLRLRSQAKQKALVIAKQLRNEPRKKQQFGSGVSDYQEDFRDSQQTRPQTRQGTATPAQASPAPQNSLAVAQNSASKRRIESQSTETREHKHRALPPSHEKALAESIFRKQ